MARIVAFHDEGAVLYIERAEDVEDHYFGDAYEVPDELLDEWNAARAAARSAEARIFALIEEQQPPDEPRPKPPPDTPVEPTAPFPTPRTLGEYQRDQEVAR